MRDKICRWKKVTQLINLAKKKCAGDCLNTIILISHNKYDANVIMYVGGAEASSLDSVGCM